MVLHGSLPLLAKIGPGDLWGAPLDTRHVENLERFGEAKINARAFRRKRRLRWLSVFENLLQCSSGDEAALACRQSRRTRLV